MTQLVPDGTRILAQETYDRLRADSRSHDALAAALDAAAPGIIAAHENRIRRAVTVSRGCPPVPDADAWLAERWRVSAGQARAVTGVEAQSAVFARFLPDWQAWRDATTTPAAAVAAPAARTATRAGDGKGTAAARRTGRPGAAKESGTTTARKATAK